MRDYVIREDHPLLEHGLAVVRRNGSWRGVVRLRESDARIIPTSMVLLAHQQRDGAQLVSTIARDIAAEQRHERVLGEARERAEAASAAKSRMLTGLSHELRTPLGAILGFAQVLRDGRAGKLSEEQQEYVQEVLDAADHQLRVINDALDLARVESGALQIVPVVTGVRRLVASAVQIAEAVALERGIRMRSVIADDVGTWTLDADRVRQILLNYLGNAAK
jgi:signal transduction histidine kinase